MSAPTRRQRAVGAILGALIGDALGVGPHWYYDLDELKKEFGPWIDDYQAPRPGRYHEGLNAGENSQTGQVLTLLLESAAERGNYDEDDFTRRLDGLFDTLDGTPKGGRYTDEAMREVWKARKAGLPWAEAGSLAATAEAAIRVPVLSALYGKDYEKARQAMLSNVRLTHADPFVTGNSVAFGLIVQGMIDGIPLAEVGNFLYNNKELKLKFEWNCTDHREGRSNKASFVDALLLSGWVTEAAHDPGIRIEPASAVCRLFGLACWLDFMLPAAYYFATRFEGDFENAVLSAINGGGNNMARAALTGAISGAQVGLEGIPERFVKGLYDHERLIELAEKVAQASSL